MKFPNELIKGKIIKRYKRFLADVELETGEIVTAHTANTGSMKTCWEPGWPVYLSYHDNPKRKLKYSLEMTFNGDTWIGVNTAIPNKLAFEAITEGKIPELDNYTNIRPEVKIGQSRIDLMLSNGDENKCYVEIKNVTLKGEKNFVLFPDGVTERGQKHLRELIEIKNSGTRACMLYIVQREDVSIFSPAKEIDPTYSDLLSEAEEQGVEILVYQCNVNEKEITIKKKLDYKL